MAPEITLFSIIMLLGAAHGVFLALALINTKGAGEAGHNYLAVLTLAFAIDLGHEFLFQSQYLLDVLVLAYTDPITNLMYGPAFYLYTRMLTDQTNFRLKGEYWLHFLPVAASVLLIVMLPELSPEQHAKILYGDGTEATQNEGILLSALSSIAMAGVVSIGVYIALSITKLVRHARVIRQQFSSIERITLNWLRNLLIALSVLYLMLIFDGFLSQLFNLDESVNRLLYLAIVAVIYAMGYLGLRQPIIFSQGRSNQLEKTKEPQLNSLLDDSPQAEAGLKAKYQTSALDAEMSAALRDELIQHMTTERSYLNSKLTLAQLAEQLGISSNYLSQVINEQFEKNFFDYINGQRVEEAKRLLTDNNRSDSNILKIALDAGFNSKSSFYTAFNKHVGVTPSQYRKSAH